MSIVVTPIPRLIDLAAPSFTLGTANAAGSAVTAVASDSTLLAFDTTLPDAITYSQSGATGSATVVSRRDHAHAMAAEPAVTTLVITGSKTMGANAKSGITLSAAAAGPLLYIWDAWIAVDDIGVTHPIGWSANETLDAEVGAFINRYSQTAGSTSSDFIIVNGTATSRTIQYRVYQLAT